MSEELRRSLSACLLLVTSLKRQIRRCKRRIAASLMQHGSSYAGKFALHTRCSALLGYFLLFGTCQIALTANTSHIPATFNYSPRSDGGACSPPTVQPPLSA